MVERVAAVERIDAIISEPGKAFVEAQSPGIEQVNAAQRGLPHQRGDTIKSPHPHEPAY